MPAIRWCACDIFVFRFYVSGVAAGLRTCMPAISMITLTTWNFYDPFMHLDRENNPEYWPLSIVLAFCCNSFDFSSLKLKRVWTPQLKKLRCFCRHFQRNIHHVFGHIFQMVGWICIFFVLFSFITIKTQSQKRFSSLWKKSVGLPNTCNLLKKREKNNLFCIIWPKLSQGVKSIKLL